MSKKDTQKMEIKKALETTKKACKCKFDSTIELHLNTTIKPKSDDQNIRTTVTLPKGTGKQVKVAVFASEKVPNADLELSESDLGKIEKGDLKPGTDFDLIVSEPSQMPKLAKVARILGPQGMMPNPKNGTVTKDVEKAVEQIKKGKIEIRNELNGSSIHTVLGKKSFSTEDLLANYTAVMNAIKSARPQKIKPEEFIVSSFVCSTMSPAIQVEL